MAGRRSPPRPGSGGAGRRAGAEPKSRAREPAAGAMEPVPAPSPGPSRSFKEELLCAVCYDPFRDAVTLRCGHNFCRGCVTRCWEAQVAPTCPVCKERAAAADLRTNHTLNNLVEKLLREEAEGARWPGPRSPRLCRLHRGPFSLFCLDDKELLCCSCQADPRHQGHRVQPVKDTAHDFRVSALLGGRCAGAHVDPAGPVRPARRSECPVPPLCLLPQGWCRLGSPASMTPVIYRGCLLPQGRPRGPETGERI